MVVLVGLPGLQVVVACHLHLPSSVVGRRSVGDGATYAINTLMITATPLTNNFVTSRENH